MLIAFAIGDSDCQHCVCQIDKVEDALPDLLEEIDGCFPIQLYTVFEFKDGQQNHLFCDVGYWEKEDAED
jgi:hypothetical protein